MDKKSYRVRNWKEYNEALVQRGSLTFWFDENCLEKWRSTLKLGKRGRGRPEEYSDIAIHCGLTLKAIFRLTFRGTEGFLKSLMSLLKLDLATPDYTLLCKRQKNLSIDLPRKTVNAGEGLHIVVDATGLKVYGEGEWKVRQHDWDKRRVWRKLHLAVNSKTHEIEAFELTDLSMRDGEGFPLLMNKITTPITECIGDGAYDNFSCYAIAEQKGMDFIAPPCRKAKTSDERRRNKKKATAGAVKKRDDIINQVRKLGRKEWKIQSGYHRRSLAETAMFRVKTLLGSRLSTKKLEHQRVEAAIWCQIINKVTIAGMPISVAIS
jgi:hypothetical protein